MFLGFNNRVKRVIFILPLLLISNAALSDGTYWRINAWYNEDTKSYNSGGFDLSKCDLSRFPTNVKYGDSGAPRDDMVTDSDENYIITTYGKRWEKNKKSGIWKYSEGVEFKAPQQYRQPILSALKKALAQGNCIAAADLADGLANGQECFGDAYCFENTNDDGSKNQCYVKSNGENKCKISDGKTEETLPDGTPKINVDCPAGQDCRRETDLDGYANQSDAKKDKGEAGNKGIRDIKGEGGQTGQGSDNDNKSGGKGSKGSVGSQNNDGNGRNQGGGVTGDGAGPGGDTREIKGKDGKTGKDSDNEDKGEGGNMDGKNGTGKGGSGTGTGSGGIGTGNGKGNGGGVAGNGKGDKDTSDVDFFDAPSIEEAFAPLQKVLKDKFSPKVDVGGGDCPKPQFNLMGRSFTVSAHCEILAQLREQFAALMMFLYTFAAIRIVLSA